jgi:type I restriction enzyme M protein
MISRKNRMLTDEDIAKISSTYHAWRNKEGDYEDVPGFCKSATHAEVEANNYVLTPGRYVGAGDIEDDGVSFEQKIADLTSSLKKQFEASIALQEKIKTNLKRVGIEID